MEYGAHLPADRPRRRPRPARPAGLRRDCRGLGLPLPLRQRPPPLPPALARRPDRARRGHRRVARHDARHDASRCRSSAGRPRWPRPSPRSTCCRTAACSPGVGPGSSARDYAAAGDPVRGALARASTRPSPPCACCSTATSLQPRPVQRPGPPIWVASWGSPAGLRRVARHGRRLAGVGLQHHARALPRGGRRAPRHAQRARNGLALRHRGRRAGPSACSPTSSPRSSADPSRSSARARCPSGRPRSAPSA